MSQIILPFTINDGDPESAGPVMANYQAIVSVVNGSLEAGTNVLAAPPAAQTGAVIAPGSSSSVARADHQHAIRGVEQLASDPTSNNFQGRLYQNTGTGKLRYCTDATGSGTFVTVAPLGATDLPNHAASHTTGADQLSPPRCRVTRTGTVGLSDGILTTVNWTSEIYDSDTMHDNSTNPSRITFQHAGVYSIKVNIAFAANGTGARWAAIQLNGAGTVLGEQSSSGFSSGDSPSLSVSCDYLASASDYVEVVALQNSGGTLNILGTGSDMAGGSGRKAPCFFSARWVSSS